MGRSLIHAGLVGALIEEAPLPLVALVAEIPHRADLAPIIMVPARGPRPNGLWSQAGRSRKTERGRQARIAPRLVEEPALHAARWVVHALEVTKGPERETPLAREQARRGASLPQEASLLRFTEALWNRVMLSNNRDGLVRSHLAAGVEETNLRLALTGVFGLQHEVVQDPVILFAPRSLRTTTGRLPGYLS